MASFSGVVHWVEKHPYLSAGGVFIGGAVLIYLYYGSGSSAAPQSSADANYQAGLAAQVQLAGIDAQFGAQTAVAQAQQAAAAQQVTGAVSIAQLQSNAAVTEAGFARDVALAGTSAGQAIQLAGIAAQRSLGLNAQNNQTVQIAGQQNEAEYLAGLSASTQNFQIQANAVTQTELTNALIRLGLHV